MNWHGSDGFGFVLFLTGLALFWLLLDGLSRGWLH